MPTREYVGQRLRDARLKAGVKQSELAARVGISASYLNLIEHDRRRIAGKLLGDLARALSLEPRQLSGRVESALLDALHAAAAGARSREAPGVGAELDDAAQLAARFPGWAGLIAAQHQALSELARGVEELSDRMAHDPFLAENLHEILSAVTAIRSTASILQQTPDIDPDWQSRFHSNLTQDSTRLAATAQALVTHLDQMGDVSAGFSTPQAFVEEVFAAQGYRLDRLEQDPDAVEAELAAHPGADRQTRAVLRGVCERYARDVRQLPLRTLCNIVDSLGFDPAAIVARSGLEAGLVLRRLAVLGAGDGAPPSGLAICDGAGAVTFRKPVAGFSMPRYGAACPLWPLFQSLHRPAEPVAQTLRTPGGDWFSAFAVCQPRVTGFGAPPVLEAVMLLIPTDGPQHAHGGATCDVGPTCRICPRAACAARRDASILTDRV